MAKPFPFTQELADVICEGLINGQSLRSLCLLPGMPSAALVCRWLDDDDKPRFREQYERAREAQADTIADEILYIADNTQTGVIVTTKADGSTETKEADMAEHRRIRIDARKWYAGKLRPKKYGDRATLDVTANVDLTLANALRELPDK